MDPVSGGRNGGRCTQECGGEELRPICRHGAGSAAAAAGGKKKAAAKEDAEAKKAEVRWMGGSIRRIGLGATGRGGRLTLGPAPCFAAVQAKKDAEPAAAEQKRSKHSMIVDEALSDDHSVVGLPKEKMIELGIAQVRTGSSRTGRVHSHHDDVRSVTTSILESQCMKACCTVSIRRTYAEKRGDGGVLATYGVQGEYALLKGKKRKDTICVAVPDDSLDANHVRLTKVEGRKT